MNMMQNLQYFGAYKCSFPFHYHVCTYTFLKLLLIILLAIFNMK